MNKTMSHVALGIAAALTWALVARKIVEVSRPGVPERDLQSDTWIPDQPEQSRLEYRYAGTRDPFSQAAAPVARRPTRERHNVDPEPERHPRSIALLGVVDGLAMVVVDGTMILLRPGQEVDGVMARRIVIDTVTLVVDGSTLELALPDS